MSFCVTLRPTTQLPRSARLFPSGPTKLVPLNIGTSAKNSIGVFLLIGRKVAWKPIKPGGFVPLLCTLGLDQLKSLARRFQENQFPRRRLAFQRGSSVQVLACFLKPIPT